MKRVVLVCPGRGSYGREELGWLGRREKDVPSVATPWIDRADTRRRSQGLATLRELDGLAEFRPSLHLAGQTGSGLIYVASRIDAAGLDRSRYRPVAVVGNSLGWYTALAGAGVFDFESGLELVDTMGAIQQRTGQGAQIIYPEVNDLWQMDPERTASVDEALSQAGEGAYRSIRFGGFAVLGAVGESLAVLERTLIPVSLGGRTYPFRLAGSSAFHTPLAAAAARAGREALEHRLPWGRPELPLVDGRGHLWTPGATDPAELARYTLEGQVTRTFNFREALRVALAEFAPDLLVLLGPGDSLGAAAAQTVIRHRWWGVEDRKDFLDCQSSGRPVFLSMGRSDQAKQLWVAEKS